MKILIKLTVLLALTSCGKVLSPQQLLNPNYDQAKQDSLDDLKDRVAILEKRLDNAYKSLDSLTYSIDNLEINQDQLEQAIALNLVDIANIESTLDGIGHSVTEIIDPCGDDVGEFDEVLLKMSNGDILAYFEQGNKRFLSTLPDNGNFITTDKQGCQFSMVNGEYDEN